MDGCALALRIPGSEKDLTLALGRMRRNARMKRDVFLADIGTRPLIMGILNVTPDSFFDGGASRKRFLGSLTGDGVEGTLVGSLTASLSAITAGAAILRVHDVEEHAVALRVLRAMRGT